MADKTILNKEAILKEIKEAENLKTLDEIYKKYLGKKGEITLIFRNLKNLPKEKRSEIAKEANTLKVLIEEEINFKSKTLKKQLPKESLKRIDITLPGKKLVLGHLHPLTKVLREVNNIFNQMGFEVAEGPEIENEYYNFDALNIPKEHPARDMWDTFWLKPTNNKQQTPYQSKHGTGQATNNKSSKLSVGGCKLLLRTHTSPVQIRYMEAHQPPFRVIVPGRCFRREATDASHEIQFYQLEGLVVGKDVSLANLKAVMTEFLNRFFRNKVKIKFQPSYFPFVEPGLEVLISQDGKKWTELIGSGMVHPNVFKAVGYNPKYWQGFAFGMGIERLAMVRHKINDIRLFYNGDLRFLNQF